MQNAFHVKIFLRIWNILESKGIFTKINEQFNKKARFLHTILP